MHRTQPQASASPARNRAQRWLTAAAAALIGVTFYKVLLPSAAVVIDSSSLALTVGLVFLAVLVVTIPPALRAARLPVVEALRVED